MTKLIQNAIKTHDGVILCSRHTHDFNSHNEYSIDGGLDYIKITYPVNHKYHIENLFLYENDSNDIIKKKLLWGTYNNNKEFKYVKLYDCETEHLENILKTQRLNKLYNYVILYIIEERKIQLRYKKIIKLKYV